MFRRYAGTDGGIDGRELQMLLNEAFKQGMSSKSQSLPQPASYIAPLMTVECLLVAETNTA